MGAWLQGEWPQGEVVDQATVTRFAWEAECLEDPQRAERLETGLPPEKRAELLLMAVEMLWPEDEL